MYLFKLKEVYASGLPGFPSGLKISIDDHLTTLIGPNGSGKTTTLLIISSALSFLNACTFEKQENTTEYWLTWESLTLTFFSNEAYKNEAGLKNLGSMFNKIEIKLIKNKNKIFISKVMSDHGGYEINDDEKFYLESEELVKIKTSINNLKQDKDRISKQISNLQASKPNHPLIPQEQKKLDDNNKSLKDLESRFQLESIALIDFAPEPVRVEDLAQLLQTLNLPSVKNIVFGETDFSDVQSTIRKISEIKGGDHAVEKYIEVSKRVRELLQQEPHFYNDRNKNKDFLTINGVDYQKVSTGTKVCLYYFSLIYETNENDIIIWDEPENGLHPTRRFKLLELILSDNRQFIIATHSTELAPIFDKRCTVYRTSLELIRAENRQEISFKKLSDKRDAFALADELGLNPSKLLFTSNVAIWVEGPSDMIFWRKVIQLHPEGSSLVEGFDYTFVLYGGKCISHLTALETNEQLDVFSISSHPVFIVDSDVKDKNYYGDNLTLHLKEEAKRIQLQFENDNRESGSSLFICSAGREMENYLPIESIQHAILSLTTSIKKEDLEKMKFLNDDWEINEKYFEMISRKFIASGFVKENNAPIGQSRWGEKNKTSVVKHALDWEGLSLGSLNYDCAKQVDEIIRLIKRWQI